MNRAGMILLALALASGCGGGGSSGGGSGTGTVQLSVTDAPYPYDLVRQATIVVGSATIRAKGGSESGFSLIDSTTRAYDLVQLQRGQKALIATATVPAGTYDEVRLEILSATIVLSDGRSFPLTVPSGASSGLKVKLDPPLVVTTGLARELVLDFDLGRSFSPIPNAATRAEDVTGFHFHPVLRASIAEESGIISGRVTTKTDGTPIANATVTVKSADGTVVQTGATAADGTYKIAFLTAGSYRVSVEAPGLPPSEEVPAAVTAGNEVTVDFGL